jgi:ABC-type Fe3+/spermidine/putrescine transport system ATPase subunit
MQSELKALQRRLGVTAVFVTHDQEEAMSMADRIVVMRNGMIVQVGAPEELFANPVSPWVCDFVGAGNLLRGALVSIGPQRYRMEIGRAPRSRSRVHRAPGKAAYCSGRRSRAHRACSRWRRIAVTARRFLGLSVELTIGYADGVVVTQVPVDASAQYPIGAQVRVSADQRDCRLLADD